MSVQLILLRKRSHVDPVCTHAPYNAQDVAGDTPANVLGAFLPVYWEASKRALVRRYAGSKLAAHAVARELLYGNEQSASVQQALDEKEVCCRMTLLDMAPLGHGTEMVRAWWRRTEPRTF